jgi:hypothetical protein
VKTIDPCELRDLDGSYLLVQPVGESRCRILDSNVAQKGQVLYKPELLSWAQAAEDLGGYTRLSPDELLGLADQDSLPDPDNLVEALGTREEILVEPRRPDPEGEVVDPGTLPGTGGNLEADDPQAELLRLAIRHQNHRGRRGRRTRSAEVA